MILIRLGKLIKQLNSGHLTIYFQLNLIEDIKDIIKDILNT